MEDRRQEFSEKTNELQKQREGLEAKGQEIADKTDIENPANNDRRAEFNAKAQSLLGVQSDLQRKSEDIVRKSNAGMDAESVQEASGQRELVDKNRIREFTQILEEYKEGKKNLDERIKNNQEWWKLRHYGNMPTKTGTTAEKDKSQKQERPKSVTAWTVNAIINKHADYMDNYPEASCLPVEEGDREYASTLSSVIPAVFERCGYEQTYSDVSWYKLIAGTGVTGYFWNKNLLGGLGDIDIKKCDILNLFWEPGITDIQDSEYFFHTKLISNKKIINMFPDIPELKNGLSNPTINITKYVYDDTVKTTDHSVVVDVYYHKQNENGKSVLHYCKYVNDIVLFASENVPEYDEKGYYEHGKYPYEFDTMFPVEGSPCGFGYVDIVKEVQRDIDELNDDFMHNAKEASHRRYIVRQDGGINEEELADVTKEVIHAAGNSLDEGNFKELVANPLDSIYVSLYEGRINEIKEVSNNRDVSSGGTMSGVTAASAIAAMQEAGSKTSRDQEASCYRSFQNGCYLIIELMGQFYEEDRYFRVTGEQGEQRFIAFNNSGIKEQTILDSATNTETSRKPIFDIKVKPQKRSQYSKLSQNELMMQLYGASVFDPRNATQAAMLVRFMDFEGKDEVLSAVSQNGTVYQQLMQYQQLVFAMAQQLDVLQGTEYALQVQNAVENGQIPQINITASTQQGTVSSDNNTIVDRAREASRQKSEVR